MATSGQYEVSAMALSGNQYTVEQTGRDGNLRPEYEARDVAGDTIFRTTYRMYQGRDEFPFVDADGTEICRMKAIQTWDVAGDYLLTDSQTEEDLVVLDNDFSLFQDAWRLRDPDDGSLLADLTSRGALFTVGRKILPFGQWIGHAYEITDAEGDRVGSIEGEFAVYDTYDVTIDRPGSVPTAPVVIGAVVVDAIQGN